MKASTLITLCRECAHGVYGFHRPTPAYGETVARLLMGTAATESHLVWRRQGGFDFSTERGAWGIWQTEQGSVGDNIKLLQRRADLRLSAAQFLYGEEGDEDLQGILQMGTHGLLRLVHSSDRFAVLMCRLHYFHKAEPVPSELAAQAQYYKIHYNTVAGKGSVEKYLTDWRRLVGPAL